MHIKPDQHTATADQLSGLAAVKVQTRGSGKPALDSRYVPYGLDPVWLQPLEICCAKTATELRRGVGQGLGEVYETARRSS